MKIVTRLEIHASIWLNVVECESTADALINSQLSQEAIHITWQTIHNVIWEQSRENANDIVMHMREIYSGQQTTQ